MIPKWRLLADLAPLPETSPCTYNRLPKRLPFGGARFLATGA